MGGQSKLKPYIQYIFIAFLTFLIFPNFFYKLPESGTDPSWNISLHLAHKYDLIFGKDFVFTYGPFGVLYSRLPISVSKYFYLLFDLYFLGTFIFVIWRIFKAKFNFAIALFAFLCIIVAMYEAQEQWFFFFLLFFLFSFLKDPAGKMGYLIQAALISIFCFYYKLGLGISSLVIFATVITYAVATKKLTLRNYGILLFLYLICIGLCAFIFNVNLIGYLRGSMHLIDAYNDSMFIPLAGYLYRFGYAAIGIIAITVAWILYRFIVSLRKREFFKNLDELFMYLVFAMGVYVLFKSAFVRTDGHLFLFFKSMSLFITILYLFSHRKLERRNASIACWLVVLISLWALNTMPGSYKPVNRILNLSFISVKLSETKNYFAGLKTYDTEVARSDKLLQQDNEFRKIIGDHSADIIPFEVSKIYFNGLRYNPRPVIQSYSAYDEYLDELNYKKYISANAPDYVLFSLNTIDDRFSFFDETKTKLALFSHYKIIGEVNKELVLKKRDTVRNLIKLKEEEKLTIKLGEEIPVKLNPGLQISRVFIEYNLWGKSRRLLYQPPTIRIFFTLENGEVKSFRVSKSILEAGVILNKFADNDQEFQLLMLSNARLNTNVKKIRIESDPANSGLIRTARMENTFYLFAEKPTSELTSDSIAIVAMTSKYKPSLLSDSTALQPDSLRYNVEDFSTHGQTIRVSGWAFSVKSNNKDYRVKAILKSGDVVYELPSEIKHRPDLTVAFKREDIEYSGISSLVSKSQLPPGDYKLGIGIFSPDNKTARITYTDHNLVIGKLNTVKKINRIETSSFTSQITYNIDLLQEEEDRFLIQGWAFLKNAAGKNDSINLVLQNQTETYQASVTVTRRVDVAAKFKNPLFEYSGFSLSLPKEKLPAGEYSVLIEKVDERDQKHNFVLTDKKIKIGEHSFNPMPLDRLPTTRKFDAVIDQLDEEEDVFNISGWAVENFANVQNSKIEIILKNETTLYVVGTTAKARPDVTAYFNNEYNLDNSGFVAKISKKDLKKGKYEIGISVQQNDNNRSVKYMNQFITRK